MILVTPVIVRMRLQFYCYHAVLYDSQSILITTWCQKCLRVYRTWQPTQCPYTLRQLFVSIVLTNGLSGSNASNSLDRHPGCWPNLKKDKSAPYYTRWGKTPKMFCHQQTLAARVEKNIRQ